MQAKRLTIPCLLLVLILVTLACGKGGTPDPTATPAVPLVGRVLLLGNGDSDSRAIFEFRDGMQSPQLLWTMPGGKLEAGPKIKPIIIPSPNHHYAMVVTNHTDFVIIDLTNGETYNIDLPEREYSPDTYDITGTFSPDGRYLAYALTGASATYSGLFLYDLAMHKSSLLFEGKCHSYVSPETVQLICGEVGRPVWLDETTIVFKAFAGKPPEKSIGGSITSNRKFVTDVNRRLVQDLADSEYATDRLWIATVAGPVILPEGYTLPSQLYGVMLLAPDERSVLRLYDDTWHLTGLYDGTDVELKKMWLGKGNGTVCYSYSEVSSYQPPQIRWSPDGKSVACALPHSEGTSMYIFYLSDQPSREVLWKDFHGYLVDWNP